MKELEPIVTPKTLSKPLADAIRQFIRKYFFDELMKDLKPELENAAPTKSKLMRAIERRSVRYVDGAFVGKFDARWDGNRGVMREHFIYDSGATQDREWRLELGNDGRIKADADDLVEPGTGQMTGSAVQLKYRIRLPQDAGGHVLDTVDWMYLAPNGTVMNRSQFRKFGIPVAELVATMRKVDAA